MEESRTLPLCILKHDCHVRSTMIWERCAAKASTLADLGFLRAGIVKNGLILIYKHHVSVLGDHQQAWNVDTPKSKKMKKPGVWRCSWWLHLHIPWAQTESVDAKWCEMNPVHIWIELRLKSTQPVDFFSQDGHLKTVRTMSEKRVMKVFVIRWVASIKPLYIPKTAPFSHNISTGMRLAV